MGLTLRRHRFPPALHGSTGSVLISSDIAPAMVAAAERRASELALERPVPGPGRADARAARRQRRRGALPLGLHARTRPVRGALGDSARPPAWRTRRARRLGEAPTRTRGRPRLDACWWRGALQARKRMRPGLSGLPIRSDYAAWWRTLASSFSRRRTFRSRGGTEASTSSGKRRSISRARCRRRSRHSTRETP